MELQVVLVGRYPVLCSGTYWAQPTYPYKKRQEVVVAPGLVGSRCLVRIIAPMMRRRRRHRIGRRSGLVPIGGAISARFADSLRGCVHYPSAAKADKSREGRHAIYIGDEESIVPSPNDLHISDIHNSIRQCHPVGRMGVAGSTSEASFGVHSQPMDRSDRSSPQPSPSRGTPCRENL